MTDLSTLIHQGRKNEIWTKYLGFLELNPDEFMEIQERLLLEQIDLLGKSMMGRMLMGDVIPKTIKEFREIVPLTSYKDYQVYLDQKKTDVLPREPIAWAHTSGRSGDFKYKWAPYTQKMFDQLGSSVISSMILSACSKKGEINLGVKDKVLLATAHEPYISGLISNSADQQMDIQFLPPLDKAEEMEFLEIIQTGFKMAMIEGMDFFYGLASILVSIGQRFEQGSGSVQFSAQMLRPDVLYRLLKSFLKGKIRGENLLPKDIWKLKGIMTGGVDTSIYKKQIEHYWGRKPLEGYACTEGGSLCMQAWNYQGMTFIPETCFLEFIPHEDHKKSKEDPNYQPKTVLYNELEEDIYELVFTNFHGGIFTRYRVGDLFQVISLTDEELNINLPQVQFYSRDSDVINLAGFALITEKDIWKALEKTETAYREWVARKEVKEGRSFLHVFLEMEEATSIDLETLTAQVNSALKEVNSDYHDMEEMLGYQAIKVSLLNPGAFGLYMDYQKSQGADLAHTKPPHMKPTQKQLEKLLQEKKMKD
jgi:hypothetical protein